MKKQLLAFLFTAVCVIAVAQKKYIITPSHVYIDKAEYGMINTFKIFQENTSNEVLTLKWKLISDELVKGWDYSSCAFGTCYISIPDTLCTMKPILPHDEPGFISLLIDPKNIKGTGKASLYLYDSADPSVKDTITFIISTADVNGIHNYAFTDALKIYPNPATETIQVKIDHAVSSNNSSIHIMDVVGKTVYDASVNPGDWNVIPVNSLAPGIYFVRYDDGNRMFATKKLEIIK